LGFSRRSFQVTLKKLDTSHNPTIIKDGITRHLPNHKFLYVWSHRNNRRPLANKADSPSLDTSASQLPTLRQSDVEDLVHSATDRIVHLS
jgi:hypothetical protein